MRPWLRLVLLTLAFASLAPPALVRADELPAASERIAPPSAPVALASDSLTQRFAGFYVSGAYPKDVCTISAPAAGILRIRTVRFMSIGFFDGREFAGVARLGDSTVVRTPTGAPAWLRAIVLEDGRFDVTRWVGPSPTDVAHETWTRASRLDASSESAAAGAGVEQLPEPIEQVSPDYPDAARRAGVEGTVIVRALVSRDGVVKETHVLKSIPALDASAVAAVKQWRFKPATAKGAPVEVWVTVPVAFRLK